MLSPEGPAIGRSLHKPELKIGPKFYEGTQVPLLIEAIDHLRP
jgi:hypothetical protein